MGSENYKDPDSEEVEECLKNKGWDYIAKDDEFQFPCPFNDCDTNRKHPSQKNFHCSINAVTGQYYCQKCHAKGNLTTLKQFLGDEPAEKKAKKSKASYATTMRNLDKMAMQCHKDLVEKHDEYRKYFQERGISLVNISKYRLGCLELYGKMWLTIPIYENGKCAYLRLRCSPKDKERESENKYIFYPKGSHASVFGGDELKKSSLDSVLICGGELDRIIGEQMDFGMPIISGTGGESTFKDEWINTCLQKRRNIYICFDADKTGREATESLAKRIEELCPKATIFKVVIPESLGKGADLTDANKAGMTAGELLSSAVYIGGVKPIDTALFREMTTRELADILNSTIKYDDVNKVVVFLAMLSTYTEEDQLNVFLNARSSSGKSYIVQEASKYFPEIDILDFCKVTPTAFFYNESSMRTGDNGEVYLDLARKILIFYDQVDTQLQANLRSLLSHDKKRLPFMNTNKGKNGANTATIAYLLGFPSTFFCSANMKMDEQEQSRAFLLSPEITQEKLSAGVDLAQVKMSDKTAYDKMLSENKERQLLIDRVLYIKSLEIYHINIPEEFGIAKRFKQMFKRLEPRAQRDIMHLGSLAKAIALLNAPFREMRGQDLIATQSDVDQAFELWSYLNRSQQYGISPQALDFYKQVILPAFNEKRKINSGATGVTVKELNQYNIRVTGTTLKLNFCRNEYIPVLEASGLISCEKNPDNRKEMLIVPLVPNIENPPQANGDAS